MSSLLSKMCKYYFYPLGLKKNIFFYSCPPQPRLEGLVYLHYLIRYEDKGMVNVQTIKYMTYGTICIIMVGNLKELNVLDLSLETDLSWKIA